MYKDSIFLNIWCSLVYMEIPLSIAYFSNIDYCMQCDFSLEFLTPWGFFAARPRFSQWIIYNYSWKSVWLENHYDSKAGKSLWLKSWGGRVVRWCWINFQFQGVLLIWIIVGQGAIALAEGAGGVGLAISFSRLSFLFFLPLSGRRPEIDWNTVLKGCLTQNNQPNWLRSLVLNSQ